MIRKKHWSIDYSKNNYHELKIRGTYIFIDKIVESDDGYFLYYERKWTGYITKLSNVIDGIDPEKIQYERKPPSAAPPIDPTVKDGED